MGKQRKGSGYGMGHSAIFQCNNKLKNIKMEISSKKEKNLWLFYKKIYCKIMNYKSLNQMCIK
jgi:hypothetical protein